MCTEVDDKVDDDDPKRERENDHFRTELFILILFFVQKNNIVFLAVFFKDLLIRVFSSSRAQCVVFFISVQGYNVYTNLFLFSSCVQCVRVRSRSAQK